MTAATATARFVAVRAEGRYRVQDTELGIYVVTTSSKAKAQEKADAMNAATPVAEATDADIADMVEREAEYRAEVGITTPVVDRAQQAIDDARAHLAAHPELMDDELAAVIGAPEVPAAAVTADTTEAPKLVSVWVGWRIADGLIPLADDLADPALASVAAKLRDRQPNKLLDRTIRLSFAECSALSAHATFVENEALGEDASAKERGPLVYSARTLRGRLASAWA
jgi:hypothetical protein